jgi:hypothetical protein
MAVNDGRNVAVEGQGGDGRAIAIAGRAIFLQSPGGDDPRHERHGQDASRDPGSLRERPAGVNARFAGWTTAFHPMKGPGVVRGPKPGSVEPGRPFVLLGIQCAAILLSRNELVSVLTILR